jgi:hypothetical protein
MLNRDPRCVFVADTMGLAEIVASWLRSQEIPAEVMDLNTLGGLEGLTPFVPRGLVSARGIEVWVTDLSQAEQASQLLKDHAEQFASRRAEAKDLESIEVECEECGATSTFPGQERGTVQDCQHCGAYLDVPGEEESWEEVEGTDEAE